MQDDVYLRVFRERSELVQADGGIEVFTEGIMDAAARARSQRIVQALQAGYLEQHIDACRTGQAEAMRVSLTEEEMQLLDSLVDAVTSEIGRALLGLTMLQLCVKAIEPAQSIRLHKGGSNTKDFSWQNGISMRSLDSRFITPVLRQYDLLKLNADGFMMTRSLAENYPYSPVYKAHIRGAKEQWIEIVEALEAGTLTPAPALDYLISKLVNRAEAFHALALRTTKLLKQLLVQRTQVSQSFAIGLLSTHLAKTDYAARIMEIVMHSLMQAMIEYGVFGLAELKPLSQMRSANKKHGNVGDIEILEHGEIIEAWDAKYGKTYLRDELEELTDKLASHPTVAVVGFVTSSEPDRIVELTTRLFDIQALYGVSPQIVTFHTWVSTQFGRAIATGTVPESELAAAWLRAYTESLAQLRRAQAPIDEPCHEWLKELAEIFTALLA